MEKKVIGWIVFSKILHVISKRIKKTVHKEYIIKLIKRGLHPLKLIV